MELKGNQADRLVQTNFVQLEVKENNRENSAHFVPTDIVQESVLLHRQLPMFPRTPVDTVIVRLLRRLQ